MPVNLADLPSDLPANGHALRQNVVKTDRRRRARICLHWTARLLTSDEGWVEASIHDISSDGFYCLSKSPFPAGATLLCEIVGPAHTPNKSHSVISIECKIKIIHSDPAGPKGVFGTGCHIQEYRFSRPR
jgi:hypothetical protein